MINILHFVHFSEPPSGFGASAAALADIASYLLRLEKEIKHMTGQLDALRAAVERTTGVVASAVALIDGLVEKLSHIDDPTGEIAALTAALSGDADQLAAAVASAPIESDPPAPPPEPTPEPPAPHDETPPATT
jgi:hypothetical protein